MPLRLLLAAVWLGKCDAASFLGSTAVFGSSQGVRRFTLLQSSSVASTTSELTETTTPFILPENYCTKNDTASASLGNVVVNEDSGPFYQNQVCRRGLPAPGLASGTVH
jgi:hypothetical protein